MIRIEPRISFLKISKRDVEILIVFLVYRLIVALFAAWVVWDHEPVSAWVGSPIYETHRLTAPDWGTFGRLFINNWFRWDTGFHLKIAALGYDLGDGTINFPPAYPLAVRLVAALTRNYMLAGLLVSSAAAAGFLILFYRLGRYELGSGERASKLIVLVISFPTAFYLVAGYSESLYLLFAVAAFLAARQSRWWVAGSLAALAALTRLPGALLCLPILWMWLAERAGAARLPPSEQVREVLTTLVRSAGSLLKSPATGLLPAVMPVIAAGCYFYWVKLAGWGTLGSVYSELWGFRVVPPWETFRLAVTRILSGQLLLIDYIDLALLLLFVFFAVIGLRKIDPAYSLFVWGTFALMSIRTVDAQLLTSYARYMLGLFPVLLVIVKAIDPLQRRWFMPVLAAVSATLQLLLLWMFINWNWVG